LDALVLAGRLLLGSVFLMAALPKVIEPSAFVQSVKNYRILPAPADVAFARTVPWLELAVAISLFTGVGVQFAAGVAILLLLSFMAAVAVAIRRGQLVNCGCFGLLYAEPVGWHTEVRDFVLVLLAAPLCFAWDPFRLPKLGGNLGEPAAVAAAAAIIVTALVSVCLAFASMRGLPRLPFLRTATRVGSDRTT
jgi:uncharacterized membrane protein YphA (DoxX/SURF4 family)